MNKSFSYALVAIPAIAVTTFAARSSISAGQGGALVRLQPATPGVSQSGHANLSGTVRAGQFQGGGAGLTGMNAGQLTTGTLSVNRLPVPMVFSSAATTGINITATSSSLGTSAIKGTVTDTSSIVYGVWGVASSTFGRGVYGLNLSTSGSGAYGVYGRSDSSAGSGVYGESASSFGVQGNATGSSGLNYGVYGTTESANGRGVRGVALANSGINYGVSGQSSSPDGFGVFGTGLVTGILGRATNASGIPIGIHGQSNNSGDDGRGVFGETTAPNGAGVRGENTAVSGGLGVGVFGKGGVGVYGDGIAAGLRGYSAYNTGIYAFGHSGGLQAIGSRSTAGSVGVHGITQSTTGYGVLGTFSDVGGTPGSPAYGIYGLVDRDGDRALIGDSDITSGSGYGVFGDTDGVGIAVYASGSFAASGGKAFRIDHPMDPENKYLFHYCTEGPEPLLEYSGTITTSASGYAWVELPEYFAEINRDLRYQLTVVDQTGEFTMAIVSKKVQNNRFQIRTSRPEVEVCWEVKGVRNDAYMRHYGAPVVTDKADNERGLFEHPELYGYGRDRAFPHDQPKGYKKNRLNQKVTP
ncbi:MAG TPA: hypothetical protein PKA27_12865 [Fimbriimonadaceae bacterium]|nr:hypothetical protein [Fimbriimonadaceae bacterium]